MKKVKKNILFNLMFNTWKNYMKSIVTYHFYLKKKLKKYGNLVTNLHDKNEYVIHIKI